MIRYIIVLLLLNSCASTYNISTKPPGALISVDGKEIGKSPITIKSTDISKRYANGVIFDIKLEGYQKVKVWMPDEGRRFETLINLNPFYQRVKGEFRVSNSEISRLDLNKLVYSLMETQKKMLVNDQTSDKYLDNVLDANPTLGSAYYLRSLSYLKNNKKKEGLSLLEEAMYYSPKETEFLELYNEVKGK